MIEIDALSDLDVFVLTLWGEGRGEAMEGQVAIANVILNRANTGYRGSSVRKVCLAPWQFSCWNKNDPNRAKMLAIGTRELCDISLEIIARLATKGLLIDNTRGARHYKTKNAKAAWAVGHKPAVVIGEHEFYVGIR